MIATKYNCRFLLVAAAILTARLPVAAATPWEDFQELRNESQQLVKNKRLDEARAVNARTYATFTAMLGEEHPVARKVTAGIALAEALIADGEYEQVRVICDRLREQPGLAAGDKARIQCVLGDAAKERGFPDEAVRVYEQSLTIPDLSPADQAFVLGKLGTFYWRDDRDPERLRGVVERMLAVGDPKLRVQDWLRILATHQWPQTNYRRPETIAFAWSHFLRQPGITAKDRATAYAELIEAQVVLGKTSEAAATATAAKADEELPSATRLMAELVNLGLAASAAANDVPAARVEQATAALQASPLDRYHALNGAAAVLKTLDEGRVARTYAKQAAALAATPVPRHSCRFVAQAPLGAAGWFASDWLDKPDYRAAGFRDYSRQDAATLVADVNAERAVAANAGNKAVYFENTAFYSVYDTAGWHVFVLCGEPDLAGKQARGESLGQLEMYFAPTPDSPYYQWIVGLDDGVTSTYDWSSPNPAFRPAGPYLQTDTRILGNRIGVHVFFPWEMLYDKLPFDSKGPWLFEVIRWSPAGGLSWSGGRVHNTGKWGEIDWQQPTGEQLSAIRTDLLRKGWRRYRQARKELVDNLWASRDFGDPGFMNSVLAPEVKRLDDLGSRLEGAVAPQEADVALLCRDALGDWMEFKYRVAALRRDYLTRQLTAPSEAVDRPR